MLSAMEILTASSSSSCNDTINANKTSVTYASCSPVSGKTWKVKIVCGGGSGGGAGISNWSGLASMSNFATITTMISGASLVDCSSGAGAYYCANSAVTSCPAGMTLVSYSLVASQGQMKDGNYDYHSCAMSSGGLCASLTQPPSAVGNANYVTKCQGLCVLN